MSQSKSPAKAPKANVSQQSILAGVGHALARAQTDFKYEFVAMAIIGVLVLANLYHDISVSELNHWVPIDDDGRPLQRHRLSDPSRITPDQAKSFAVGCLNEMLSIDYLSFKKRLSKAYDRCFYVTGIPEHLARVAADHPSQAWHRELIVSGVYADLKDTGRNVVTRFSPPVNGYSLVEKVGLQAMMDDHRRRLNFYVWEVAFVAALRLDRNGHTQSRDGGTRTARETINRFYCVKVSVSRADRKHFPQGLALRSVRLLPRKKCFERGAG